jgi:ribosomal protein L11 methylase PrmA
MLLLGDLSGKSILDIGCSDGYFSNIFRKITNEQIVGMDKSQLAIY